jgi:hypothetical protein
VAELADARDLGSRSERSAGSIPVPSIGGVLRVCESFCGSLQAPTNSAQFILEGILLNNTRHPVAVPGGDAGRERESREMLVNAADGSAEGID